MIIRESEVRSEEIFWGETRHYFTPTLIANSLAKETTTMTTDDEMLG